VITKKKKWKNKWHFINRTGKQAYHFTIMIAEDSSCFSFVSNEKNLVTR